MKRVIWSAVLLLAGCGSPPTHYFVLRPEPGPRAAPPQACAKGPFRVERPALPALLDRSAMVSGAGGDRVNLSNQDRWAAPLDGMIESVLAEDLRRRLPDGAVLAPGDPGTGGASAIAITILDFLPGRDDIASLRVDWSLLDPSGKPILRQTEALQSSAAQDPATAMSLALAALADRIASRIGRCR